jgi:hypothetical protein
MTHDELLAKINEEIKMAEFEYACGDGNNPNVSKALRAVVEYHKPYESKNYGLLCRGCDEDPNYPCGTIRAIEKELV